MRLFPYGHATHPQWPMAAALVLAQVRAQMAQPAWAAQPTLGLLYLTDHWAGAAQDILDHLAAELPGVTDWAGTVGVGICANGAEYWDEPAMALMLCDLSPTQYRVFSGIAPLEAVQGRDGFVPQAALLHADGQTPDLADLVAELAERTRGHYLFGGLTASRGAPAQWARSSRGAVAGRGRQGAAGVFQGGLSGVAFGTDVPLMSRVTQGVRPLSVTHRVSAADRHVVLGLDDRPAMEVLMQDLGLSMSAPREAVARLRHTLVGVVAADASAATSGPSTGVPHAFGDDVQVRHLIGLDPARQGVAVAMADGVAEGSRLTFCERHVDAARADLVRVCTEIREALEPEQMPQATALALSDDPATSRPHPARRVAGAVYVSCSGRGGPHFGAPGAELAIVRRALGDVPLVGFFAAGEVAHHRLHGYTGVLTVWVAD